MTPEVIFSWNERYAFDSKTEEEVLAIVFTAMMYERIYHLITPIMEELCMGCQIDDPSQLHHDCMFPFIDKESYDKSLNDHLMHLLNDINWHEFRHDFRARTQLASNDYDVMFTRSYWKTRSRSQRLARALGDMFTMLSDFPLSDYYYLVVDHLFWVLHNPLDTTQRYARIFKQS